MEALELLEFPLDIFYQIVDYLSLEDKKSLRFVSTRVAQLINRPLFRHVKFNVHTAPSFANAGPESKELATWFRYVRFDGGASTNTPLVFEAQEVDSSVRNLPKEILLIDGEQRQYTLGDVEDHDSTLGDESNDDGDTLINQQENESMATEGVYEEEDFEMNTNRESEFSLVKPREMVFPLALDGETWIAGDDEELADIADDCEESDGERVDDEEHHLTEERSRFPLLMDDDSTEDEGYETSEGDENESEEEGQFSYLSEEDDGLSFLSADHDDSTFLNEETIKLVLEMLPKNTLTDITIDIRTSHTFEFMEALLSRQQNTLGSLKIISQDCGPYNVSMNEALQDHALNMAALRRVKLHYRGDDNPNTMWRFWGGLLHILPCVTELDLAHDTWDPMEDWQLSFATGQLTYQAAGRQEGREAYRICQLRTLSSLKLNKIPIQLDLHPPDPTLLKFPEPELQYMTNATSLEKINLQQKAKRLEAEKKFHEFGQLFPYMKRLELLDCTVPPEIVKQLHVFFPQLEELIYTDNEDGDDEENGTAQIARNAKLATVHALNELLIQSNGLRSLYFHITGCTELISVKSILKHRSTLKHLGIGSCTDQGSYYSLAELAKLVLCEKLKNLAIGLPPIAVDLASVEGNLEMRTYTKIFRILSQLKDLEALKIWELPYVPDYWSNRTPEMMATGSLGGDYLQSLSHLVRTMALNLRLEHSNVQRISFGPRHCDWLTVRNREGASLDWDEWNEEDCENGDKKTNDFEISTGEDGLQVAARSLREDDDRKFPPTDLADYI